MGKKDTQGTKSAPTDHYRKQIGKHDYKKSKADVKASKDRAAKKQSALGIKEIIMMLSAFVVMLLMVYVILYISLMKNEASSTNNK